jgi:hypothetical protein
MNKPDYDIYKDLAELKLQNTLLTQRLDVMTRMATNCDERRADLCRQLESHGLAIGINNKLVKRP